MPADWEVALALVMAVGAFTDLTRAKVYNWTTLPGMVLGLGLGLIHEGLSGLGGAALGLAVGGGILLVPFLMGGLGGGDVKLAAAAGALGGPLFAVKTIAYACLAGGVWALVIMIATGNLLRGLKNIGFIFLASVQPRSGLARPDPMAMPAIPFAVCLLAGAVMARYWDFLAGVLFW